MKLAKAAIKITQPDTGKVCWFAGWTDHEMFLPQFSAAPVVFSLRYAKLAADRLKHFYPLVTVVGVRA